MARLIPVLLQKAFAQAPSGIGDQVLDRPAGDGGDQLVDAFLFGKVCFQGLHPRRAQAA